jgi:DNA-binding transcriptional regulator YiaG
LTVVYRPDTWHLTGPGLRAMREDLGLSEDELAIILDVETASVVNWESDFHGPPRFVAEAVRWLQRGHRPPEWPRP